MRALDEKLALISSRRATSFTQNNVLTYDFSEVIRDFFTDNFDMSVTVEIVGNHQGHMRILHEQTFEFLKDFILLVLGKHTVKIKLYTTDENYVMELYSDTIRDMDIAERSEFIRKAHQAGFSLFVEGDMFQLYTRYQKSDYLRVHTINATKARIYRDMMMFFFY